MFFPLFFCHTGEGSLKATLGDILHWSTQLENMMLSAGLGCREPFTPKTEDGQQCGVPLSAGFLYKAPLC